MAITKQAQEQLGARIVGHSELGAGIMTSTGLIKTSHGLIAPASKTKDDTRSGSLLSEDEQPEEPESGQADDEQPAPVKARSAPVKRSRKAVQKDSFVVAEVTVEGFGSIPTQYTHIYQGTGILVVGLNALSYKPETAEQTESGELTHVIKIDKAPGRRYIYCGNSFVDDQKTTNLLLIEIQGE